MFATATPITVAGNSRSRESWPGREEARSRLRPMRSRKWLSTGRHPIALLFSVKGLRLRHRCILLLDTQPVTSVSINADRSESGTKQPTVKVCRAKQAPAVPGHLPVAGRRARPDRLHPPRQPRIPNNLMRQTRLPLPGRPAPTPRTLLSVEPRHRGQDHQPQTQRVRSRPLPRLDRQLAPPRTDHPDGGSLSRRCRDPPTPVQPPPRPPRPPRASIDEHPSGGPQGHREVRNVSPFGCHHPQNGSPAITVVRERCAIARRGAGRGG